MANNPFTAFTKASDADRYRLFGASDGEAGSRKTSFWLEGPGPVAVLSLDQGLEGVVQRELRRSPGKDIFVKEFEWAPIKEVDMQDDAQQLRDEIEQLYYDVCLPNARTVLFDKEGDFWGLFRYAEFGPDQNDAPRNYPALNQRYRKLINAAKGYGVNVGFINGMKDEWSSRTKSNGQQGVASTGNRIRQGFGELDGLVHIVLHHSGLGPMQEDNIVRPTDWNIKVGKARGPEGWKYAGTEVGNMTFQEFALLIFPDSEISDWE
jgi:hypothetical protein